MATGKLSCTRANRREENQNQFEQEDRNLVISCGVKVSQNQFKQEEGNLVISCDVKVGHPAYYL